ncbi:hypothetical protein Ciccas_008329 [Cichlidogyrus casuarinus]|uniref:Uncharacterized protein n=1 Tax=Cichlidogyrus casuarinus TaxID=1844966 RepID=A0ABD2Q0L4_9PLAT
MLYLNSKAIFGSNYRLSFGEYENLQPRARTCSIPRTGLMLPKPIPFGPCDPLLNSNLPDHVYLENRIIRIVGGKADTFGCELLVITRYSDFNVGFVDPVYDIYDGFDTSNITGGHQFQARCRLKPEFASITSIKANIKIFLLCGADRERKATSLSDHMNVLLIGMDSTSRDELQGYLPKTYTFLKQEFDVYFDKANIVGDGTTAHMLALLTGLFEHEFPESRREFLTKENKPLIDNNHQTVLDRLQWLWKDFETIGYKTHYAEDTPIYGTFQYRLVGFGKNQPTNTYARTCFLSTNAASKAGCQHAR